MAQITAALVKELRDTSGAGMMDCKKALSEVDGDIEAAIDWLRTKGLSKAAKKSGRVASEGLVAIAVSDCGRQAAVVEVNAETDFVARNEQFQEFASKMAQLALSTDESVEALEAADYGNGKSVKDTLTDLIATIGENMSLRRVKKMSVSNGVVAAYMHNQLSPGLGKIGVLVALESEGNQDVLNGLGKQVAMHVAATNPDFLDVASVSDEAKDRERAVLSEQARDSGKPEEIIAKMVEGRMRKFYEEVVLSEQTFVMDGETKISDVIKNAEKDAGSAVKMTGFARIMLGEGIEKEEADFAAEVAAAVNG